MTTTARNIRLQQQLHRAGLTEHQLAEQLGVDDKTVQRWLVGKHTPHRRHQVQVAALLRVDRADLWPDSDDQVSRRALARAELIAVYATRRDVPHDLLPSLAATAGDDVSITTNTLAWLIETQPEVIDTLTLRAIAGNRVQICLRDPTYSSTGLQDPDGDSDYPVRRALRALAPMLTDARSGGEVRLHAGTTTSIYRFGADLLASPTLAGVPNHLLPVIHVREAGLVGLFHRLTTHSLVTWNNARPLPDMSRLDNADLPHQPRRRQLEHDDDSWPPVRRPPPDRDPFEGRPDPGNGPLWPWDPYGGG